MNTTEFLSSCNTINDDITSTTVAKPCMCNVHCDTMVNDGSPRISDYRKTSLTVAVCLNGQRKSNLPLIRVPPRPVYSLKVATAPEGSFEAITGTALELKTLYLVSILCRYETCYCLHTPTRIRDAKRGGLVSRP